MSAVDLSEGPIAPEEDLPLASDATDQQIRGSSLLLVGRVIGLAITFATQIVMVRYLSKSDYGAFAYALSLVTLAETAVGLGLGTAITRFVPIYHERGDYPKLFGAMAMVLGAIVPLGVAAIILVHGLRGVIDGAVINDSRAVSLLLILIVLAPVQALDTFIMNVFAVFARPRAIFFRRYILAPALRLMAVVVLVGVGGGVRLLSIGYVAAGVAGVAVYAVLLVRMLRAEGIIAHFDRSRISVPLREVFSFTIPLLTTALVWVLMSSTDAILLGHFRGTRAVAAFRVVQPAAALNQLIIGSFVILFTPVAARMYARDDRRGIEDLYWRTAVLVAILTFPVFALTFAGGEPVTRILYGTRYASSGLYLSILAIGQYAQAATGLNGTTLMVYGKLRFVMSINLLVVALNLGLNLILIPHYGALGAAIGTSVSLVLHNFLKQAGLRMGTGVSLFPRRWAGVYVWIAGGAGALLLIRQLASSSTAGMIGGAAVVSALVVWVNRRALHLGRTFPELLRIPGLRAFIE